MGKNKRPLEEIAKRCAFLHSRKNFIEKLLKIFREELDIDGIAVGDKKGLGFDNAAISLGYPIEYLVDYCNMNHDTRNFMPESYTEGQRRGYSSSCASEFGYKKKFPKEYRERYERHGIKDTIQTSFFDSKDELMGAVGIFTGSREAFTKTESAAIDSITPYLFYAFMKYRRIANIDLFNVGSFEDILFGIIISDKKDEITYMNAAARHTMDPNIGDQLPRELKEAKRKLDADCSYTGELNLAFRELASQSPIGDILAFHVDREGSKHLPIKGEGLLFILDNVTVNMKMLSSITKREREVLVCIIKGLKDKEIAMKLFISEYTVHAHLRNIFTKLGVKNRTEATKKAISLGFS